MSPEKNCNENYDQIEKRIEQGQVKVTNMNTGKIINQQVSMHNQCTTLETSPEKVKSVTDNALSRNKLLNTSNEENRYVSIIPTSSPNTTTMLANKHREILSWPDVNFSTEVFLEKISCERISAILISLKKQSYATCDMMSEVHV